MLFRFVPIMSALCSLLLPIYYSNDFAGKINASLIGTLAYMEEFCRDSHIYSYFLKNIWAVGHFILAAKSDFTDLFNMGNW